MPANFVSLTKECGLFLPPVYITCKYTKMTTETARSHKAVTRLITRVCDEPASLQPYCTPSLARELPKHLSPGTQPQLWLAEVTRNASSTWLLGLGVGFFACLWWCGSAEHPSPCHCLSWEKSPTTCPPGFFSSVLHSWLNEKSVPCKGKWLPKRDWAERVFLTRTHKYLETSHRRYSQSLTYELGTFPPPPGSSSVSHQLGAHWEQFWKKTKLVYPSKKHSKTKICKRKQKTDCCSRPPFPPWCVPLCNVKYNSSSLVLSQIYFAC